MTLLEPTPILTAQNRGNRTSAHTEFDCQLSLQNVALRITLANFFDLFFCKLRNAVSTAAWLTLFGYFIGYVVIIRAKKQMCRVTTSPIVAFMENVQSIGNLAIGVDVSNAMDMKLPKVSSVPVKAISVDINWALPFPTFIWRALVDLGPKVYFVVYLFGLEPFVVIADKTHWFAFGITITSIFVNSGFLPTAALTIAIGDFVRGIMGMHRNLSFRCQARDTREVSPGTFHWLYSFILAQMDYWRNPARVEMCAP